MAGDSTEPLDRDLVASLETGGLLGDSAVEHVQTHISHLFLTPTRVFKLRKAVRFPFADFSTRRLRANDCVDEVRLNRRLAPDVYLGLCTVEGSGASARLGPLQPGASAASLEAADREVLVVMRRLPADQDFASLLEARRLEPEDLAAAVAQIAELHRMTPYLQGTAASWADRRLDQVAGNLGELEAALASIGSTLPDTLERYVREQSATLRPRLEQRFEAGRAVEGHGDLRLEHCWRDDDGSTRIIDCVEFSRDLRLQDPAMEIAFLSMELREAGHEALADHVLSEYAAESDDYDCLPLVRFFEIYRACVRAKVAALASLDTDVDASVARASRELCDRHLATATRLATARCSAVVVALCGTIASGKSSAARQLTRETGGIVLASDRLRNALTPEAAASEVWGGGGYSEAARSAVYDDLFARAGPALDAGHLVWLDASFASAERRTALSRWAAARHSEAWMIEVRCDDAVALDRLQERSARGDDASRAGPALFEASRKSFEPPAEWPAARHLLIDATTQRSLADGVARTVSRIRDATRT